MKKTMKTLKTFLSIFVLALSFVLVSCNQKQQNNLNETNNVSEIMQVDSLLNNAEKFVGDTIVIDGVCTHICQHGGKKIFLMGSDDTKPSA